MTRDDLQLTSPGLEEASEQDGMSLPSLRSSGRRVGAITRSVFERAPSSGKRRDIQGLRAIAVAGVIATHLGLVHGGFLGVDIFFVVSGYLITQHLLREVDRTGTIRVTWFWARRIRRLLPAVFAVLIVVDILALRHLTHGPQAQDQLDSSAATSAYVYNWFRSYQVLSGPYTGHLWTLSVEEQFYAVWPLLIVAAAVLARRGLKVPPKALIAVVLGGAFVASVIVSIHEVRTNPWMNYLSTPPRVWEFAAGGLVAMLPVLRRGGGWRNGVYLALGWSAALGLALAIASPGRFDSLVMPLQLPWQAVLCAAMLIWLGDSESPWAPQALLHPGPVQFLGDISYGFYLWHLVIIAALPLILTGPHSYGTIWLVAGGGSIILGAASKYLLEDPIRRATGLFAKRWPAYTFMVLGILAFTGLAAVAAIRWHDPF